MKKPAEAIYISLSLSFEGSIEKLLDFQHWKLNDISIGYYFTTSK